MQKDSATGSTGARVAFAVLFFLIGCGQDARQEDTSEVSALTSRAALLVVGNTSLSAADAAFQQRLATLGFTITVRKDSASTTADATGKQLVAISSTVTSTSVGTKFKSVAVPVLSWEPSLSDDMAMTDTTSGTSYGTTGGQTQLALVAASADPMTAGLSGVQTVVSSASTFTWGQPASTAVVVARLSGSSTRAAIYRYEKGASMVGFTAPERRVGFFLNDTTATALTATGQVLTDAAIRWAARLGGSLGTACSSAAGCGSGFCVDGVCCDSACTGQCVTCNAAGKAGTCTPRVAGTTCGAASCSGSTFTAAPVCNGAGTCASPVAQSCLPYQCGGNACQTSCTSSSVCAAGFACINAICTLG